MVRQRSRPVPRGTALLFIAVAGWCLVVLIQRYGPLLLDLIAQLGIAMPVWVHP